jgi:hypothetical protein
MVCSVGKGKSISKFRTLLRPGKDAVNTALLRQHAKKSRKEANRGREQKRGRERERERKRDRKQR